MQFAVIKTGGKQYKVAAGDTIKIEKLADTFTNGDAITFDEVLMVADDSQAKIGTPALAGASVKGTLIEKGRAQKIMVVKYKQKSRYLKRNGHRQPYFAVKIDSISA